MVRSNYDLSTCIGTGYVYANPVVNDYCFRCPCWNSTGEARYNGSCNPDQYCNGYDSLSDAQKANVGERRKKTWFVTLSEAEKLQRVAHNCYQKIAGEPDQVPTEIALTNADGESVILNATVSRLEGNREKYLWKVDNSLGKLNRVMFGTQCFNWYHSGKQPTALMITDDGKSNIRDEEGLDKVMIFSTIDVSDLN